MSTEKPEQAPAEIAADTDAADALSFAKSDATPATVETSAPGPADVTAPASEDAPVTAPLPRIVVPAPSAPPPVHHFAPAAPPVFHHSLSAPNQLVFPVDPASQRKPSPVLGPVASVFGALLWSFVVAGQFTTSWVTGAPLAEGLAVLIVLAVTSLTFVLSLRRSRVVPMANTRAVIGRAFVIGLGALIAFAVTIAAATVAGAFFSRSHDLLIALGLSGIACVATIFGPRLTAPAPIARSHAQKFLVAVAWTGAALITLVAFIELATNG